ncbi:MAG: hypothetical protein NC209_02685 [Alistipes sp.]|nr:hypothetical protein [Alistipes sp.]
MTGALSNVGMEGECWSASPASAGSASGAGMAFNANVVYPLHVEVRSYGFTVRCVQHLQAAFLKNNLFLLRQSSYDPE